MVGRKCSHHCATLVPLNVSLTSILMTGTQKLNLPQKDWGVLHPIDPAFLLSLPCMPDGRDSKAYHVSLSEK